jgi:hypothetical protein
MFDWLTNIPTVSWATTITVMVVAAVGVWLYRVRKDAERKAELHGAEDEYRKAVASGDVDRINIAAKRLRIAKEAK